MVFPRYRFYTNGRYAVRMLICPHCDKRLQRFDIEEFLHCPYCNFPFEMNPDLEAFVLQPVVNEWVKMYHNVAAVPDSPLLF